MSLLKARADRDRRAAELRQELEEVEQEIAAIDRVQEILDGTPTGDDATMRSRGNRRALIAQRAGARASTGAAVRLETCALGSRGECAGKSVVFPCGEDNCDYAVVLCVAHSKTKARGGLIGGHRRSHKRVGPPADPEAAEED